MDGSGFARVFFCDADSASGHLSGLFARRTWPLALMMSANRIPFRLAGLMPLQYDGVFQLRLRSSSSLLVLLHPFRAVRDLRPLSYAVR